MWAEDYPVALTRAMPRDLPARVHGMTGFNVKNQNQKIYTSLLKYEHVSS
jgi:hypothetical protein